MWLSGVFGKLKHFDAYPKPLEDFRVKTVSGAIISVVCIILVVLLFLFEWSAYMTVEVDQELFVDLTRNQKLTINLDVTFPRLHCSLLSLDAMDVSGDSQLHVAKGLKKMRLNADGVKIGEYREESTQRQETTTTSTAASGVIGEQASKNDNITMANTCMSCYGAETSDQKCCNTCDQVRMAYRRRNWHFSPFGVEQCKQDLLDSNMNMQASSMSKDAAEVEKLLALNEGCQLYGHLEVNKLAGNFHIAPGTSFQQDHMHVHDVKNLQLDKFNTSHYFDTFSFGDEYPNQLNPLEKKSFSIQKPNKPGHKSKEVQTNGEMQLNDFIMFDMLANFGGAANQNAKNNGAISYNYFLKIVPTIYEYLDGRVVNNTYQYSLTKSSKPITTNGIMGNSQLPGVYVVYELSPIMVRYVEKSKSFSHFLTSCFAIIGGLFTIAGMLDALTFRYYNMYKKYQMNKLT